MKNLTIVFIFIYCCSPILLDAQANNISTTGKWGTQIFLSDVNGRAFVNKYADVNGSAYLFPDFKYATIILSDGRKYTNVKARLNLVEHEVNFIASNGEEGYIGKGMVNTITISDTNKQLVKSFTFRSGYPKIDQQTIIHFYQVLASGRIALLKSINKNIEERLNELSGEKTKEFAVRENIYVQIGAEFKRIKKEASFFLSIMADQKEAVNQYINTNKLNCRNEGDIINLVNYYNSL